MGEGTSHQTPCPVDPGWVDASGRAPYGVSPQTQQSFPELRQPRLITRHRVVEVIAPEHRLQPLPGVRHRVVSAAADSCIRNFLPVYPGARTVPNLWFRAYVSGLHN